MVADGHGSPACSRADRGSQLAVDAVFDVLANPPQESHDQLALAVVGRWREAVEADLSANSPDESELMGAPAPHHLLYGTTAVGVAADEQTLTVLQIGDGDVLVGQRHSEVATRPIAPRNMDRPGATESLCQSDAESRVRIASIDLDSVPVDAVLIATDGLDTAFADAAWHDETMRDLLHRLQSMSSPDRIEESLEGWCEPPAAVGGDDTTIGLLVRHDLWSDGKES